MIEQPSYIFDRVRKGRGERFLLICYYDPMGISAVPEIIGYIQKLSVFPIVVVNIFECRDPLGVNCLPANIDLHDFSGVIIHNSISYDVDNLRTLDVKLRLSLKNFGGLKILFKQDENHKFRELAEYIGEVRFDLVLTCLSDSDLEKIYPKKVVGNVRFMRMLTGYVTPTLRAIESQEISKRKITIGYRGSIQPLSFGRLAYEKRSIGEKVIRDLRDSKDVNLDVSSKWEDRLGTDAWFEFLGNCRATLGAESGASVFDVDGSLKDRCALAEQVVGDFREDADYAERYLTYIADLEGVIKYNQISPRHFEAAATKTLQILYPGEYSGVLLPNVHYIELARDHSNIMDVVSAMRDDALVEAITERAYKDVVLNPEFGIEKFVYTLDECIKTMLPDESQPCLACEERKQVILLCSHPAKNDPRISWIKEYAPDQISVNIIDVLLCENDNLSVSACERGGKQISLPRINFTSQRFLKWQRLLSKKRTGSDVLFEIARMEKMANSSDSELAKFLRMPEDAQRIKDFKWYLRFVLDVNTSLLEACLATRNARCLIATDLVTLPAAILYGAIENIPVYYDAHEFWPASDTRQMQFEQEFWLELEANLIKHTADRITVSPGLKKVFEDFYGFEFKVVPNCEPLRLNGARKHTSAKIIDGSCKFLFQGAFAPHRGLEDLITVWAEVSLENKLILRGPANDFRNKMIELSKSIGLFGRQIFFPDAVAEDQLVEMAGAADVGIIPYKAYGYNYAHCCPNKLSQYMAAGIPIIANKTSFVASIIHESKSGLIVDFSNKKSLLTAISELSSNAAARREMGEAGRHFHQEKYNWQHSSLPFYDVLTNSNDRPTKHLAISTDSLEELIEEMRCARDDKNRRSVREKILEGMMPLWMALPLNIRNALTPVLKKILGF